jgi:dCMP deaminase
MRITRDEMLMEVAHVVAKRGTCSRLPVGAVFAQDGRIVATGYNGAPRGMDHCTHKTYEASDRNSVWGAPDWVLQNAEFIAGRTYYFDGRVVSTDPGCTISEHAERNAIYYAAAQGITLGGSDLYVTHQPCSDCARALVSLGVRTVTYAIPYRKTAGRDILIERGIKVIDLSSAAEV